MKEVPLVPHIVNGMVVESPPSSLLLALTHPRWGARLDVVFFVDDADVVVVVVVEVVDILSVEELPWVMIEAYGHGFGDA